MKMFAILSARIKLFTFGLLICWNFPTEAQVTAENKYDDLRIFHASMKPGVACYRIPALVTAPNGDLIAAIDERMGSCGDLKFNRDINIVIRRSTDHGKTWSAIETVVDYPIGQSASDPSMIVDRISGEIIMLFNYMDLDKEKDVFYFRVMTTGDNGKTWSTPKDITASISRPEWRNDFKFITSGRGIQTQSGKLLHNVVNIQRGVYLFQSDDHGNTWTLIDTPVNPADESKVVELPDGKWIINSRVNNLGLRVVHTSSDNGKHWTTRTDSALVDPGCNAGLLRHDVVAEKKTILLFSNLDSPTSRENLILRFSSDDGMTWSKGKKIHAGSSAYSTLTMLNSGDIGILYERNDYSEVIFTAVPWTDIYPAR
jgi:sialidase-1